MNYNRQNGPWRQFADEAEPELRRFEAALRAPREMQEQRLQQILHANADTEFGREHEFDTIRSIADYRRLVPAADWSSFADRVNRSKAGEQGVLTAQYPVHFERTSGSGSRHKDIPYTSALLREFQSALVVWLAALVRACPEIAGPSYWSLSPDRSPPETTARGVTVGSAGDALYLAGSPLEKLLPTVIGAGALRSDGGDWQLGTLGVLAAEPDLRMLSVWSPTFLQSLLDGVLDRSRLDASLATLAATLPRARLRVLLSALAQRDLTLVWPRLRVISCWTDGPSAEFAEQLGALFPGIRFVPKGLLSTEGVVSVPFGIESARPVAITSHFVEFVDDDGAPRVVDQLEAGRRYSPLMTTSGGLYRYRLGDIVEVTGFVERTPCLRFVGREDHRSDLVGEKIDEGIVSRALRAALPSGPSILVPIAMARPPRYLLIAEIPADRAAEIVELELCRAHHYSIARRNRQLGAVTACHVHSLAGLLHAAWQEAGRRSGDAKPAALISSPEFASSIVRSVWQGEAAAGR